MPSKTNEPKPKRAKISASTLKASTSRYISSSLKLNLSRHPLSIKPSGNLIISTDEQLKRIGDSMGIFKKIPDELILKIVNNLNNKDDLKNLMFTSKFFYGFVNNDEIWKSLYLNNQNYKFDKWLGSWKKSVLGRANDDLSINCDLIYSDMLYVPYQNSQVNYETIFHNIIKEEKESKDTKVFSSQDLSSPLDFPIKGRIPRLHESSMTMTEFNEKWHNYPFIVKNSDTKRWPRWDIPYLLSRFPDVKFREECVDWPLSLYNEYSKLNLDENPLYLFDCNSEAMKQLKTEFERPLFSQCDYFTKFVECRPDNTWLIMGPSRSGSTFHKDPNSTSAWNTVMMGSKLWIMLPPDMKPPGITTDDEESEVTSPLGLAEWVLSGFYNDSVKLSDSCVNKDGYTCLIGVTFEGECIHVPAGWWHTVINIGDSVALTANFVPEVKLGVVLNFFKNKKDQISGFHPKTFNSALKKFLLNKREEDFYDVENFKIFQEYLHSVAEKQEDQITDEDVGELDCEVDLPIYSFFIELLHADGCDRELEVALQGLKSIEKENNKGKVKKSEVWEQLTKEGSGFSFGFDFEE